MSFVSVTQQFNTTSSMGRLTLNVLLSFAQFEREVTGERIRDKIAASKRKGLWMGGIPPLGYRGQERTLVVDEPRAQQVREIYALYRELGCVRRLQGALHAKGWVTAPRLTRRADAVGGRPFSRGHLYRILANPIYRGQIAHKGVTYPGRHPPIVDEATWQAVQGQLAANRQGRRARTNSQHPSVLAGLLFDTQGERLTATHARKGPRRYRYYVSHALVQAGAKESTDALRIPAAELENVVIDGLVAFLTDRHRLLPLLQGRDPQVVTEILSRTERLAMHLRAAGSGFAIAAPSPFPAPTVQASNSTRPYADLIILIRRLVERITVAPAQVALHVRLEALGIEASTLVGCDGDDRPDQHNATTTTLLTLPVTLKRGGMAMRLIVNARTENARRRPDPTLVGILAKANQWFLQLTSSESSSVLAIAQSEQVTSSYVTRVLYLAFLAPDVALAIARGDQPATLTAKQLLLSVPLPPDWVEQRHRLGFA